MWEIDGILMPTSIRVTRVKAAGFPVVDGMRMTGTSNMWARSESGHAAVRVEVLELNARTTIKMTLPAPAGSNRSDSAEIAFGRALMMLDPAQSVKSLQIR
ncbi:MAG: hypothetical protein WDZ50_06030 [Woeseia sp.]